MVGSGKVGTSAALHIALKELDDITLIDIVEGLPQGEAIDLSNMCAILGLDVTIKGTNDFSEMRGSDLVIVTAGLPRKAGMTREELLQKNAGIVRDIGEKIREYAPDSRVIITTNPLDAMTYVLYKTTGFGRRVMGFSGILDASRLSYLIRNETGISYTSIDSMVIGQHGEAMVFLPKHSYVGGRRLTEILSSEKIKEIVERAKGMGAEIIKLRGYSSNYAPGAGLAVMAEAVLKDQKKVISTATYLDGEYGVRDVCIGVPAVIGRDGVEEIIELPLDEEERKAFQESVEYVRKLISQLSL